MNVTAILPERLAGKSQSLPGPADSLVPPGSARPPRVRLEAAYAAEERAGYRLGFRLRLTALAAIAVFVTLVNPFPAVLYYHALLLAFAVIGAGPLVHWRRQSGTPEWTRWTAPVVDIALVTFAVIYPNPFGPADLSRLALVLRSEHLLYPVLFIALATLSYSPRQVLWTGTVAAGMWVGASFWVAGLPGMRWSAMGSDPQSVMAHALVQQVLLLLVVTGLLAGAVSRARGIALRQVKAERERTELARYFSTNIVEHLANADRPPGEVRSQSVAILFADIVGFTSLAETLSPVELISLLREFHHRMQSAVFAHGGTLDKYLGDGLMATFGTPSVGPRDAANALAAARAMTTSLGEWNASRQASGEPVLRIGIGVHFGPVVLGDIGGDHRLEFATIGDAVNVASRLEHLSRDLDADIVISCELVEAIRTASGDDQAVALLDGFIVSTQIGVRGRNAPVEVFAHPRIPPAAETSPTHDQPGWRLPLYAPWAAFADPRILQNRAHAQAALPTRLNEAANVGGAAATWCRPAHQTCA